MVKIQFVDGYIGVPETKSMDSLKQYIDVLRMPVQLATLQLATLQLVTFQLTTLTTRHPDNSPL
jgi:hypothetical protein